MPLRKSQNVGVRPKHPLAPQTPRQTTLGEQEKRLHTDRIAPSPGHTAPQREISPEPVFPPEGKGNPGWKSSSLSLVGHFLEPHSGLTPPRLQGYFQRLTTANLFMLERGGQGLSITNSQNLADPVPTNNVLTVVLAPSLPAEGRQWCRLTRELIRAHNSACFGTSNEEACLH